MANIVPAVISSGMVRRLALTDTLIGESGLPPLYRIDANTTLYVATTGNDTTGDGTSGNPWATVAKALAYLGSFWISSVATVTISVGDGTYTTTSTITPNHPCGARINITGANTYARSVSSVQSSSGSSGAWSYILNMNSVANIAVGDYIVLRSVTGGSNPLLLTGCHYISNVDTGNVRITITNVAASASVASGACACTGTVIKAVLNNSTNGIGIYLVGSKLGTISNIVIKTNVGTGVSVSNGSMCSFTTTCCVINSYINVRVNSGSSISGTGLTCSGGNFGAIFETESAVELGSIVVTGAVYSGVRIDMNSVFLTYGGFAAVACATGVECRFASVVTLYDYIVAFCTVGISVNRITYVYSGIATLTSNGANFDVSVNTWTTDHCYVEST